MLLLAVDAFWSSLQQARHGPADTVPATRTKPSARAAWIPPGRCRFCGAFQLGLASGLSCFSTLQAGAGDGDTKEPSVPIQDLRELYAREGLHRDGYTGGKSEADGLAGSPPDMFSVRRSKPVID